MVLDDQSFDERQLSGFHEERGFVLKAPLRELVRGGREYDATKQEGD